MGEMAEVRYDIAMSLSKGCGGSSGALKDAMQAEIWLWIFVGLKRNC